MAATLPPGVERKPRPVIKRTDAQKTALYQAGGFRDFRAHHLWHISRIADLRKTLAQSKADMQQQAARLEKAILAGDATLKKWALRDYGEAAHRYHQAQEDRYRIRREVRENRSNLRPLP